MAPELWLFAAARGNRTLQDLILPVAGTVLAVAVLVWLCLRVRAWFHEDDGPADSAHEMLAQYRDLQRQGVLTDEEFRSIKRRLAGEIVRPSGSGSPAAVPPATGVGQAEQSAGNQAAQQEPHVP